MASGVVAEAVFAGIVVKPVREKELAQALIVEPVLTFKKFFDFYIPLAMTSLLLLLVNPLNSAAVSRMPSPIKSLAIWPVLAGLIFMFRSFGIAYNEVVVALLDRKYSSPSLLRYTSLLTILTTSVLLLITVTPLSNFWLETVSALSLDLATIARNALWLAIPLPALAVLQSWYQGNILHSKQTRGITEAVVIYLISSLVVFAAGIVWGKTIGIYVGIFALTFSVLCQTFWLWIRSRTAREKVRIRDLQTNGTENNPA